MDINSFLSNINPVVSIFFAAITLILGVIIPTLQSLGIKSFNFKNFKKIGLIAGIIIIIMFVLFGIIQWNSYYNPQFKYKYATGGNLLLNDPLTIQDNNKWDESNYPGFTCAFMGESYHAISSQPNTVSLCLAHAAPSLTNTNFTFEVQMRIIKGDAGGIAFQANGISDFYRFTLHANGFYELYLFQSNPTKKQTLVAGNENINVYEPNLLTVKVSDGQIQLYINGKFIADGGSDTFSFGEIGVFGYSVIHPTDVLFNHAQIWSL